MSHTQEASKQGDHKEHALVLLSLVFTVLLQYTAQNEKNLQYSINRCVLQS